MESSRIKVKASGIEYTDKLRTYIASKLQQLDRLIPKGASDAKYEVEIGKATKHHKTGLIYRAEINLSYGSTLNRAEATDTTIIRAIDAVKEEIKTELRKGRGKKKEEARKGARVMKKMVRGE